MSAGRARSRLAWLAAAIAALLCGGATRAARQAASTIRQQWPAEVDELYLPPASTLRLASLGHTELFADLLAIRTNVYFGEQLADKGAHRWLDYYLDAIVELDPYFEPIYLRGATMLVYNGRQMSLEMFEKADALLARGLQVFPGSWELWFQRGFNLAFEMAKLVPADSPRRAQWLREGTEALRRSTLFAGVPPHLPSLVARMLTEQGERELAIQHLERAHAITNDPNARAQIELKLHALMGEHVRASYATESERLRRLVEERYPYAPEAFSLIAGPRAPDPVRLDPPSPAESSP